MNTYTASLHDRRTDTRTTVRGIHAEDPDQAFDLAIEQAERSNPRADFDGGYVTRTR